MRKVSCMDSGCFLALNLKRSGTEPTRTIRMENETMLFEIMMINFCEGGHLVLRKSCVLKRADLKSKGKGKSYVHFNVSDENSKWFFPRSSPSMSSVSTEQ